MTDTILLGIALVLSAIQRTALSTLSKAFSKSTKTRCKSELYSAVCSMINARRSSSEACMLKIYGGIKMVFYPVQYELGDHFADCEQDTYSLPIIANL